MKAIVPAVLSADPNELRVMVGVLNEITSYAQVDFMDGDFVPSKSVEPVDLVNAEPEFAIEAHLMAHDPMSYLNTLSKTKVEKVIFHFSAVSDPVVVIEKIREKGLLVGLAINPTISVNEILPLVDLVDSLLVLSVHPGYYGKSFISETFEKIGELREKEPGLIIGVDGGIKLDNAKSIIEAGADYICIGSAILKAADPGRAMDDFTKIIQRA